MFPYCPIKLLSNSCHYQLIRIKLKFVVKGFQWSIQRNYSSKLQNFDYTGTAVTIVQRSERMSMLCVTH